MIACVVSQKQRTVEIQHDYGVYDELRECRGDGGQQGASMQENGQRQQGTASHRATASLTKTAGKSSLP